MVQEIARQRSCSEVLTDGSMTSNTPASKVKSASVGGSQNRNAKPQVQDERAVSIDIGRFKGAKNSYNGY